MSKEREQLIKELKRAQALLETARRRLTEPPLSVLTEVDTKRTD